jgi:hypothetical protein
MVQGYCVDCKQMAPFFKVSDWRYTCMSCNTAPMGCDLSTEDPEVAYITQIQRLEAENQLLRTKWKHHATRQNSIFWQALDHGWSSLSCDQLVDVIVPHNDEVFAPHIEAMRLSKHPLLHVCHHHVLPV